MLKPLSLHARLLLIAGLTGFAALTFAAFAIANVLEHVVRHSLYEKMETQIAVIVRAIGPDGSVDTAKIVLLPGFDGRAPGWGWRVDGPRQSWEGGQQIRDLKLYRGRSWQKRHHGGTRAGVAKGPSGLALFVRALDVTRTNGSYRIIAAGPQQIVTRPLRQAVTPLLVSLMLLGLGLAIATWTQLRFGLRPLRNMREAVTRVRTGEAKYLPDDQPKELRPLVQEMNALLDQNAAGLEHARAHVANLAHGLKTPLATLALRLEREKASDESRELVAQLDKRIAHHLRRARSASAGSGDRTRTPIAPVIADLLLAMEHIHSARKLTMGSCVDGNPTVAIDREDLDEMLGNLLDNACRFARRNVQVTSNNEGQNHHILIEDDGLGIAPEQLGAALNPGTRLDESGKGYGFGLGIVRELAELYGGSLYLEKSATLGGLCAKLALPTRN